MPLDPGRWPEMPPDQQFWVAQLRASAQAWSEEGRRLRSTVRAPALGGSCAQALWSCADQLASGIDLLARELAVVAGQPGPAPGGSR